MLIRNTDGKTATEISLRRNSCTLRYKSLVTLVVHTYSYRLQLQIIYELQFTFRYLSIDRD